MFNGSIAKNEISLPCFYASKMHLFKRCGWILEFGVASAWDIIPMACRDCKFFQAPYASREKS